jgi:hypothetical protein
MDTKLMKFFNSKIFKVVLRILVPLIMLQLVALEYRHYYNLNIDCGKVMRIVKVSEMKGQPAIIVSDTKDNYTIYEYFLTLPTLRDIEIGDYIVKPKYGFDFLLVKQGGERLIIRGDINYWVATYLYFMPSMYSDLDLKESTCK